jgi:hypothetical protein
VASVGNVPYTAGKKMAISPCHFHSLRWMFSRSKMLI